MSTPLRFLSTLKHRENEETGPLASMAALTSRFEKGFSMLSAGINDGLNTISSTSRLTEGPREQLLASGVPEAERLLSPAETTRYASK
jgi:hypothetical protein